MKKADTYKLDELTIERIKDIGKHLEYSEIEVIQILVNQYYKLQTIKHEDDEGIKAIEYIPFYETQGTYQQLKDDYIKEYGGEYPARLQTRQE